MLETKSVGDKYKMLVTVSTILVNNINYLFTYPSGTNISVTKPDKTVIPPYII